MAPDPFTSSEAIRARRLPRSNLKLTTHSGLPRRNKTAPKLKGQRTSKTSQKLVVLPSAPQTERQLSDEDLTHGYETDTGVREMKSEAEMMTKEQRKEVSFVFAGLWGYAIVDVEVSSEALDIKG
jgi:hypothetical protein